MSWPKIDPQEDTRLIDHFPCGLLDGAAGDALLRLADGLHHDVALLLVHELAP